MKSAVQEVADFFERQLEGNDGNLFDGQNQTRPIQTSARRLYFI